VNSTLKNLSVVITEIHVKNYFIAIILFLGFQLRFYHTHLTQVLPILPNLQTQYFMTSLIGSSVECLVPTYNIPVFLLYSNLLKNLALGLLTVFNKI